jgi:hypothetical protein
VRQFEPAWGWLPSRAVVCDFEDFVSEVFRLTLSRENIQVAKFLAGRAGRSDFASRPEQAGVDHFATRVSRTLAAS